MKHTIVFYGFRHSHINGLYKRIRTSGDFTVAACLEPDAAARAAAERTLGATFTDTPFEDILAREDVDTVAVGCAYGDRGRIVLQALTAGKHVIADKPICTSIEELRAIERAAYDKHLTVACMLDLRYLPATRRVHDLIRSGRLGEVKNVIFGGQHCLDYAHRPSWYFEDGMHGGTINDLAIHGVDLVRMLTGMEIDTVDAARVWNSFANKHVHFKDCAMVMARLSNGAGVLADVSYSAPSQVFSMPTYWEFRLFLERGVISFRYADATVSVFEEGAGEVILDGIEGGDCVDEFLDCVTSGDMHMTENILRSTEAVLRLQRIADGKESV